jgi:hypothetical protein
MKFNPPDCWKSPGLECCAGYVALYADWHRQRQEIHRLREELASLIRSPAVKQ